MESLWSTVIHHRCSSAPRSALTVQGPLRVASAPFVVPPSGGLSFPAEAGTPTGSSHLEKSELKCPVRLFLTPVQKKAPERTPASAGVARK